MEDKQQLLDKGKMLPLMEDFYTIQGEGFHTGKAAHFIRIGGCDNGCSWCDEKMSWNMRFHPLTETEKIIEKVIANPANAIVVTGGEPTNYNLEYLTQLAHGKNIDTFLETSGSNHLTGNWNWICLSPKKQVPPKEEFYYTLDELKVVIESEEDIQWAEECAKKLQKECYMYLQPEWKKSKQLMPFLVEYVKQHPQWAMSIQTHKYMNIP